MFVNSKSIYNIQHEDLSITFGGVIEIVTMSFIGLHVPFASGNDVPSKEAFSHGGSA